MKNIVLIGFMGSGKSTVGKKLAEELKYNFVDTDELIEKREGETVKEIFEKQGEGYFRALEKEVVAEVSAKENLVISCGGGVVLDEENVEALKKGGFLIYLKASYDTVCRRLKSSQDRPLLNVSRKNEEIRKLLCVRGEVYEKVADVVIDTGDKNVMEVVKIIKEKVKGKENA